MRLDRKITWTGERFVVTTEDTQTAFQHTSEFSRTEDLEAFITRVDPGHAAGVIAELGSAVTPWPLPTIAGPIGDLISEIELNLHYGLFLSAVIVALAIPDICAAAEYPVGEAKGGRYRDWCQKWLIPLHKDPDPAAIYQLRCGILHQARSSHKNMAVSEIVFTTAGEGVVVTGNMLIGGPGGAVRDLDARTFCRAVIAAAIAWNTGIATNPNVKTNLKRALRYKDGWRLIGGIRCLGTEDA
jgi:hypothetical protein